ncbi:MATE family efflux transporter [Mycoplasma sp. SG1]|uniref:MATE family efflux transporter n=1 Tax=Mycoplasma sp. SG1 TaxID=2810348 RepID=UPI0020257926|nr:MATE family efflux transporter [Mycoplasma sp. SG1]URM52794.1 MATE family efflux transporter [Mycoplasma sp. SG1]
MQFKNPIKSFFYRNKISKQFLFLALGFILPATFQSIIEGSINLIDTFIIGNYNANDILAVSLGITVFFVFFTILIGVLSGFSIFSAQFFGAKKYKDLSEIYKLRIWIGLIISLLFFIFCNLFSKFLINISIGSKDFIPPQIVKDTQNYLLFSTISYFFIALSYSIHWTLRDTRRMKISFWISIIVLIFKIFFCVILTYGIKINGVTIIPRLGILGLAAGGLIVRIIEFGCVFTVICVKKYEFWFSIKSFFFPHFSLLRKVSFKMWSVTFNEIIWAFAVFLQFSFYGYLGTTAVKEIQAAYTINDLFFSGLFGLGSGVGALVGYELGRNKLKEAYNNSVKINIISIGFSIVLGIGLLIISSFLPEIIFSKLPVGQIHNVRLMLIIIGLFFPFYAFAFVCYYTIRAGGDVISVFFLDSMYTLFITTIVILLLTHFFSALGIVIIFLIGVICDGLKAFTSYLFYRRKKWLKQLNEVQEEIEISDDKLKILENNNE